MKNVSRRGNEEGGGRKEEGKGGVEIPDNLPKLPMIIAERGR